MAKRNYKINEEPNEFDDHLLDIIGNSFKFDHVKGIGEWVKNSVDAYIRESVSDERQHIILRFTEQRGLPATFECIDFVGMTKTNIDKALKRWGDPEAAKHGKDIKVYGGHGNGGKFYMREMFDESYFITYRDGKLNIFGFSENKKYGFAHGFKDLVVSPTEALKIAEIDDLDFPGSIKSNIESRETGFTVLKGIAPREMRNSIRINMLTGRLKNHPQVRRLIKKVPVKIIYNQHTYLELLKPDPLKPLPEFENLEPVKIPEYLEVSGSSGEPIKIKFSSEKNEAGSIQLFTSEVAMDRGNRFEDLNRIDIIGELGVIASYRVDELPKVGVYPQLSFIFGECHCPILEEPSSDCVQNDRSKLVENEMTRALLEFISLQVKSLAEKINEKDRKKQENVQKQLSSLYNNFLDDWKNKFMSKVFSTILVGPGDGQGGGNGTGGSFGEIGSGKGAGKRSGGGEGSDPGGGNKEKRGQKFPRILLSGQDSDPLSESGESLFLDPRHGVIYQRPQDVQEGIYWINTSSPLASAIVERYGVNDPRWRDYLLQRYIDIFTQEALEKLERKDPDFFNFSSVNQQIREVIMKAQEAASKDLSGFLFDENFTPDQS